MINLLKRQTGILERTGDGMEGEIPVVFDAGKSLFLRRKQNLTIFDQTGSAVVVKSRDPQNIHRSYNTKEKLRIRNGGWARSMNLFHFFKSG